MKNRTGTGCTQYKGNAKNRTASTRAAASTESAAKINKILDKRRGPRTSPRHRQEERRAINLILLIHVKHTYDHINIFYDGRQLKIRAPAATFYGILNADCDKSEIA